MHRNSTKCAWNYRTEICQVPRCNCSVIQCKTRPLYFSFVSIVTGSDFSVLAIETNNRNHVIRDGGVLVLVCISFCIVKNAPTSELSLTSFD